MRFGKTVEQKSILNELDMVNSSIGRWKYAWWPTTMVDGKTIWLEPYYEVRHNFISENKDGVYAYSGWGECYAFYRRHDAQHVLYTLKVGKSGWYSSDFELLSSEESYGKLLALKARLEQKLSALN